MNWQNMVGKTILILLKNNKSLNFTKKKYLYIWDDQKKKKKIKRLKLVFV